MNFFQLFEALFTAYLGARAQLSQPGQTVTSPPIVVGTDNGNTIHAAITFTT